MLRPLDAAQSPTLNVLGNVQARGYLIGGDGKTTLTIAGENNSFVSQANYAIRVSNIQIQNNAKIENLEARYTAISTLSNGSISIGDDTVINMTSDTGYAFDAPESDLRVGNNAVINSKALFGSIRAASLTIGSGSNVNLGAGIEGNSVYLNGNLKIGDNTKFTSTGQGTGIYVSSTSASIDVGKDSDITVQSKDKYGIYSHGKITFGDGTNVEVDSHLESLRAGSSGIQFGSISNQVKDATDKVIINLNSDLEYGIWASGPVILGDSTEAKITSKLTSIYATGVSNVNIGSHSDLSLKSDIQYGIRAGGINAENNSKLDIDSHLRGILTDEINGTGLQTKDAVALKLKTAIEDGIYSIKDVKFGTNNIIDITSLTNNGIYTYSNSAVDLGKGSNLSINANTGVRQITTGATFNAGDSTKVVIDATREAIDTEGAVTFNPQAVVNIKAASGSGENAAIRANHGVSFNKGTWIYVETLSDKSRTVFDISGFQNSKLAFNGSKFIDIRQGNRSETGHIVRGHGNNTQNSIVSFNNIPNLYAWNHGTSWSKNPDGEWSNLTAVSIPLSSHIGSLSVDYFSGIPVGENIDGFNLFDYSRVSTEASSLPPGVPDVDAIKAGDTILKGKGEPNKEVIITLPDGSKVTGNTDINGDFAINIPAQKEGAEIQVTQKGNNGVEGGPAVVIVESNQKPVITADDQTFRVGDSFDPLADVTARDKEDGDLTADIKVLSNNVDMSKVGNYTVVYTVTDSDGNTTELSVKIKVIAATAGTITANDFTIGTDNYVKGALTGDVAKAYLEVNGTQLTTINVSGSSYQYYAKTAILDPADKVFIVALDANGKVLQKTEVKVNAKATTGTITAADFTIGADNYVKGNLTGDVAKAQLEVNGTKLTMITVSGSTYQYYAKNNIKQPTDQVYIIGYDASGKELQRTKVNVKAATVTAGTITPDKFTLGTDAYVKGTFTGDVAKVSLTVNGTVYQTINTPTSPFQYYAKANIKNVTDIVVVTAYDATGKVLDTKPVTVTTDNGQAGTITANSFKLGKDSYVTGTLTGDVAKVELQVNGAPGQKINVSGSTYQYYAKSKILSATDDVKMVAYNSAGIVVNIKSVAISTTDGTVVANDFTVGTDSYVTGTLTGDVTRIALKVDGVLKSGIPATAGAFQYYAKSLITSATNSVEVIAYDATG
ncbi:DUF5011 domain-containing protein, partial [Listeria booriae]|nr:DUF5011 domain-containing protein [Listeria booriae]